MVLVNTTRQGGKSLRSATFGPCCMRVRSPTPTRAIASQYMISCISVLHFFGVASSAAGGGIGAPQQKPLRRRKVLRLPKTWPGLAFIRDLLFGWGLWFDLTLLFNSVQMIPLLALCALAHSLQRYVLVLRACMYVCIGSRVWGRKKRG